MPSYERYQLQLFPNHDYYGLCLLDCNVSTQLIYRRLNKISKLIFPGYKKCDDDFFVKQWTDFTKIRSILSDVHERKTYEDYRKYAVKIDFSRDSITDWWYPFPRTKVCSPISLH